MNNRVTNKHTILARIVSLSSGAERELEDFELSRFACYLIAQNGDPRKPEIANAQKYFAIQSRRQELSDALAADLERLETRKQTSEDSRRCPVRLARRASRAACSVSFMMRGTRACTAAWAAKRAKASRGIDRER